MISRVNSGVMEGDVPVGLMDNVLREVGKIYVPGWAMDSRIIWCSTDSLNLKNVSRPGFPCMMKQEAHAQNLVITQMHGHACMHGLKLYIVHLYSSYLFGRLLHL